MLKESLAGFPTRPVVYLCIAVLALGLVYHLATTYQRCVSHASLRQALRTAIEESVKGDKPMPLRLFEITDFDWDRADVIVNYKPSGTVADCPFKWDWSRQTREAYIANDLLSVVVFFLNGKIVNYIEYPRNEAEFVAIENPYTPRTAVFEVDAVSGQRHDFVLTPMVSR